MKLMECEWKQERKVVMRGGERRERREINHEGLFIHVMKEMVMTSLRV
jgi:hypothetical protein